MKKKLMILFLSCFSMGMEAQESSPKSVVEAESLYFYGFDYTGLRVADGARVGQNLMPFVAATTELMEKGNHQKLMEIKLKKPKGKVVYNTVPTKTLNGKINNGKIAAFETRKLGMDSLSAMVKRYELSEKEGIGYTVVFACFDRAEETITAHMVFFNIANREIVWVKSLESKDKNGYNYMGDWKKASIVCMERMMDVVGKDVNTYIKANKVAPAK